MSEENRGGRVPPYSEAAERAALGAMLLDGTKVVPFVLSGMKLPEEAFYVPAHRIIFRAILEIWTRSRIPDQVTVMEELARQGQVEAVGGELALNRLCDDTPNTAHAGYYVDIVRQKWILRREIEVCREVEGEAHLQERGDEHLKTVLPRFTSILGELVKEETNVEVIAEAMAGWREAHGKKGPVGLLTPWPRLNLVLTGLKPGMYIIAGAASHGKTTMEDCLATHVAAAGTPVARVSLDSAKLELLQRGMCRKAGVSLLKLNQGYAGESQLAGVEAAGAVLGTYNMWINDRDRVLVTILSWIRAMKILHNIGLVTLDYVQQVMTGEPRVDLNENMRLTIVSGALKGLALELKIPIVVVSQLNREGTRETRPPRLSDLRGSGMLENDAHAVVFTYPETEFQPQDGRMDRAPHWFDVGKNKSGPRGRIEGWLYPHYFLLHEGRYEEFGANVTPARYAGVGPEEGNPASPRAATQGKDAERGRGGDADPDLEANRDAETAGGRGDGED